MLVDIANAQKEAGHNVSVIVINEHIDREITGRIRDGIRVFEINRKRSGINPLPLLKLFMALNFRIKPDVIHAHDHTIGKLMKFISKRPVVLTIHGPGLETEPMNYFSKLYAISRSVKKDVESRSTLNCEVLYNGIDSTAVQKRKISSPGRPLRVVMVKRLNHERKGQDLLIEAAKRIIHEKGRKQIRFDLIGDGESRSFLEDMISEFDLKDHVFLLGNMNRDEVYGRLSEYDLFVHPSRFEGFGLTVTEAMAAKLPVVASNIEGPAEILQNGRYGLMFEKDDVDGLVNQILKAGEMYTTGEMEEFVEKAYAHCIANFDIKITANKYSESYLT